MRKKALIIVDVQRDFCSGGALAVRGGEEIVGIINIIMERFEAVMATQDWHPADHKSFVTNHRDMQSFEVITLNGLPQVLWPPHCVQGTEGAKFHESLREDKISAIVRKGMSVGYDSYSGLKDAGGADTALMGILENLWNWDVYVCGLATDYCVKATAMDVMSLFTGLRDAQYVEVGDVYVITDACKAVKFPEGSEEAALKEMEEAGIKFIEAKDIK